MGICVIQRNGHITSATHLELPSGYVVAFLVGEKPEHSLDMSITRVFAAGFQVEQKSM